MAYTQIGVGAVANDNTGDPIRDAFIKVNDVLDALDLAYALSSTLVIGDDPANIGTPAGFESTISAADGSNDNITIAGDGSGDIIILPDTGEIVLDGLKWPQADGSADFVLVTDGVGQLSFVSQDLVVDTSPALGGDLDVGAFDIVSAGGLDITITPNGTGDIVLGTITIDADQTAGAGQLGHHLVADASGVMTLGVGTQSNDAALNSSSNAINTGAEKVQGYMVYNTDTDNPCWAVGSADADLWVDGAGSTVHSPS